MTFDFDSCILRKKIISNMFLNQWKEAGNKMANLDLTQYGITGTTEIVHNISDVVRRGNEVGSDGV